MIITRHHKTCSRTVCSGPPGSVSRLPNGLLRIVCVDGSSSAAYTIELTKEELSLLFTVSSRTTKLVTPEARAWKALHS